MSDQISTTACDCTAGETAGIEMPRQNFCAPASRRKNEKPTLNLILSVSNGPLIADEDQVFCARLRQPITAAEPVRLAERR